MKVPLKFLGRVSLLRAPALSPSTQSLQLQRWHVGSGDTLPAYSLLCDVTTSSLTRHSADANINTFTHAHHPPSTELQIEVQEDVILARQYVATNEVVSVGDPLALLCEETEDITICAAISADEADKLTQGKSPLIAAALWQAYLAAPSTERGCS